MHLKHKMIINDYKVEEFKTRNKFVVFVDDCLYPGSFDEACQELRTQQAIEMGLSRCDRGIV